MLRNVTGLDLRLLRIFACVVEYSGFTAARAKLSMSQSNISMHTTNLEKRLDYQLCERDKGDFRLTAEGRRVLEAPRMTFDAIGLFRNQAQALSGRLVGELYLGLTDNLATLPQARFDDALVRFQRHDQDAQLNPFVSSSTELELAVIEGELDLAISYFSRSRPNLEYHPLYREEIGVFCGDHHPPFAKAQPTLERIATYDWVVHDFLPESLVLPLRPSRSHATVYHMEVTTHAVLTGTHLDYLSIRYTEAWIEHGQVRVPLPEQLSYPVEHNIIVYVGCPLSEAARVFINDLLRIHGLGA